MDIGVLSKDIVEKITEEQILQMLKDLGVTPFRTTTKEIWFNTICHGEIVINYVILEKAKIFIVIPIVAR